jgi:hypothetical protein
MTDDCVKYSLTQNQIALCDIEDAEKIDIHQWQAQWSPHTKSYYAVATVKIDGKSTRIQMSRLVLNLKSNDKHQADHINHNTLDNRKKNLRIITNKVNSQNRRGVKGYYWSKIAKKWIANIGVNGKSIHLGRFTVESEARQAYLDARQKYGFIDLPTIIELTDREIGIRTMKQVNQSRRGVKGYSWNKRAKRWQAYTKVDRKMIHLGFYITEDEARRAYLNAREKYEFVKSP